MGNSKGAVLLFVAGVVLAGSIILSSAGGASAVPPPSSNPLSVKVVNGAAEAVPVVAVGNTSVTVSGTPGVEVLNTPDIHVANTAASPVPVKVVGVGGKQRYCYSSVNFSIQLGEQVGYQVLSVPAGKQFVAEYFSAAGSVLPGQTLHMRINTLTPGTSTVWIPMLNQGAGFSAGQHKFIASMPIHAFAPADSEITIVAYRSDDAGTTGILGSLVGYLEDAP